MHLHTTCRPIEREETEGRELVGEMLFGTNKRMCALSLSLSLSLSGIQAEAEANLRMICIHTGIYYRYIRIAGTPGRPRGNLVPMISQREASNV